MSHLTHVLDFKDEYELFYNGNFNTFVKMTDGGFIEIFDKDMNPVKIKVHSEAEIVLFFDFVLVENSFGYIAYSHEGYLDSKLKMFNYLNKKYGKGKFKPFPDEDIKEKLRLLIEEYERQNG